MTVEELNRQLAGTLAGTLGISVVEASADRVVGELLIRDEGVVVHPGYFFDFDRDGFLVVSLLPEVEGFRKAVGRVLRRLMAG